MSIPWAGGGGGIRGPAHRVGRYVDNLGQRPLGAPHIVLVLLVSR